MAGAGVEDGESAAGVGDDEVSDGEVVGVGDGGAGLVDVAVAGDDGSGAVAVGVDFGPGLGGALGGESEFLVEGGASAEEESFAWLECLAVDGGEVAPGGLWGESVVAVVAVAAVDVEGLGVGDGTGGRVPGACGVVGLLGGHEGGDVVEGLGDAVGGSDGDAEVLVGVGG